MALLHAKERPGLGGLSDRGMIAISMHKHEKKCDAMGKKATNYMKITLAHIANAIPGIIWNV